MRRLALALMVVLAAAWVIPTGAQASGELFVSSQKDPAPGGLGVSGLVQLSDGGGESVKGAGGGVITGTGVGPIFQSGSAIKQYSGGTFRTLATGVPNVTSMTNTGRGLVVAIANKLQYESGGQRSDVPHGTITDGPWVSITTEPNGLLLGWAWHSGVGRLYELNLGTGATTTQDFSSTNSPLLNNRNGFGTMYGPTAVDNSGGISADGQGGIWLASAGFNDSFNFPTSQSSQIYYALPTTGNFSFSQVPGAVQYTRPHIAATGTAVAYAVSTDNEDSPYFGDVFKLTPTGEVAQTTSNSGNLHNSYLPGLAIDRCYAACSVSGPNVGGGSTTQKFTGLKKSAKLGKKGFKLKLKCSIACSVTITGKLVFGKAKKSKKASAAASKTLKKTKAKLKAGKSKTVTIKLSKKQRKAVKKALHKKQKVYAKLKIVVKSKGVKTVTKRPKLRIK